MFQEIIIGKFFYFKIHNYASYDKFNGNLKKKLYNDI